jgi:predicted RND superfamily exporter protein
MRELQLELQLLESVASITSMFSMREPPDQSGNPPPLFPEVIPKGGGLDALKEKVQAHPLVEGRFLSTAPPGEHLALLVVNLQRDFIGAKGLVAAVREVETTSRSFLSSSKLSVGLTGIPVMKAEIIEASRRDRVLFPVLGFLIGCVVSLLFFQEVRYVAICMLPSSIAVLWTIGLFGFLGIELDPIKNAILPLVMVIALTDSLHLAVAARRELLEGQSSQEAAKIAVKESGTANALTAATTAIAFLSMNITDSILISSFGTAAAIVTTFGYFVVIAAVPALFVLLAPKPRKEARKETPVETVPLRLINRTCGALAHVVVRRHRLIALGGVALLLALTAMHLMVPAYYRLSDLVPRNQQAATVAQQLEKRLAGIYPITLMVTWPEGLDSSSIRVTSAMGDIHRAAEQTAGVSNVWSTETLRRWLVEAGHSSNDDFRTFLSKMPREVYARLVNDAQRTGLATGHIGDLKAREVLALVEDLKQRLAPIQTAYPEFGISVTDLSVMSSSRSLSIISQLKYSLLSTISVDLPTIGLAFGSLAAIGYGAIANISAVVAMGALMFALGMGLEYPSIIALTVTFGLTADSTIHILNRIRLERGSGATAFDAIRTSIERVGPVLLVSTIILVLGISVSMVSVVPPTHLFGKVCALTLILALPGLLILMPSVAMLIAGLRGEDGRRA